MVYSNGLLYSSIVVARGWVVPYANGKRCYPLLGLLPSLAVGVGLALACAVV